MQDSKLQLVKLNSDIKLHSNPKERELHENFADLYAIIKTTEALEKAFLRDAIDPNEYKNQCVRLIQQFKAAQNLCELKSDHDVAKFMQDYRLEAKAAYNRLVVEGIPGTSAQANDSAKTIAETVQHFITSMDSLRLNQKAVDQVFPLLQDLNESLCKISNLPQDWLGKVKLQKWLSQLQSMRASDELSEEQVRQILFDLESAYSLFHKTLEK